MEPHRCPKCDALVVDRRWPFCTTCHAELPKEWVMTPEQVAKVTELDAHARAEYNTVMTELDPARNVSATEMAPVIIPAET
jgi:hypothetical protein